MKRAAKIFLIAMCVLAVIGLVCIGVGVVLGGDFGGVIGEIVGDLYTRILAIAN